MIDYTNNVADLIHFSNFLTLGVICFPKCGHAMGFSTLLELKGLQKCEVVSKLDA